MSKVLNFLGNTTQAIGNVFGNFFDIIIQFIFVPIIVLFSIVIFFGIQYYLIKFYIFVFSNVFKFAQKLYQISMGEGIFNSVKNKFTKNE